MSVIEPEREYIDMGGTTVFVNIRDDGTSELIGVEVRDGTGLVVGSAGQRLVTPQPASYQDGEAHGTGHDAQPDEGELPSTDPG